MNQCCECKAGEHDDYDNDIKQVIVKDPDTKKVIKRGKMCNEHQVMYLDDGYIVE